MLERLGNSLKKVFRKNTIIGRLGGDEFCVYWSDVPSLSPVYRKCRQFSRHFQDGTKGMAVSVSIGVAIVKEGEDYEEIYAGADQALYQAKHRGKAQIVVADDGQREA